MKKLHFEIVINAPRQRVWDSVVNDRPYREWTAPFSPGSYFEGGWNKGDKIRFLAANPVGGVEGMASEIAESRRPDFISIHHLGLVRNGRVDTESAEAKKWGESYENYTLTDDGGKTKFAVDLGPVDDSMAEAFGGMWPRALELLKEISERA